jgi:hypothetical protein
VKGRPLPPELEDRVDPMFEQPVLGLLMLALDAYGTRRRGLLRHPVARDVRIPCRTLMVCLAEDGDRDVTRAEAQLIRQAVRHYLRGRPEYTDLLEGFL